MLIPQRFIELLLVQPCGFIGRDEDVGGFPGSFVEASTSVPGTWSAGVVPEASTWVMMAVGFAGLGFLGISKKQALQTASALS